MTSTFEATETSYPKNFSHHFMNADLITDTSWDTARKLAYGALVPEPELVRLVRNAWTGSTNLHDFSLCLQVSMTPPAALIQAAQLVDPTGSTPETVVSCLGFKGVATVASICFTCGTLSAKCPSERVRELIIQHMTDMIEIGYHFGLSAESIGPDTGMLLGFSQSLGPALMVASRDLTWTQAKALVENPQDASLDTCLFGCEPYQVASLALQRLGFGPALATGAVMALGNLNISPPRSDPFIESLWAASEWIAALSRGLSAPKRKSSRLLFADLLFDAVADASPPIHLQALLDSVNAVRADHSSWSWPSLHRLASQPVHQYAAL